MNNFMTSFLVLSLVAFMGGDYSSAHAQDTLDQAKCRGRQCNGGGNRGGNRGGNGRVDRPQRPTRPTNPGRVDRPQRPNRPTNPGRVDRPQRPNRPTNPGRVDRPQRPNRPTNPGRVDRPQRPNRPTNPGRVDRPNRPTRPTNPGRVDRPNRPTRPGHVRNRPHRARRMGVNNWGNLHRRHGHRPVWNRPAAPYVRYRHIPYRNVISHTRFYPRIMLYHYTIPYRFIYWNRWIRFGVTFVDGFHYIGGYPYFVYNGYRHRYSTVDYCNYELVDGLTNSVYREFTGYSCQLGYDLCSDLRDTLNWQTSNYRYFCAEKFEYDPNHNYDWDYDDDFYSDVAQDDDYSSDDDDYYDDDWG